MTQIHFAGLNSAAFAEALEGHPVLISYADVVRRPGVWEKEILPRLLQNKYPSVILDSGAFTEMKDPNFHVDLQEYGKFIRNHCDLFDVVVNLDDIGGDVKRSQKNQACLEGMTSVEVMPVFHGGEPWAILEGYLDEGYDHIGLGFAREETGRISKTQGADLTPAMWLDQAFSRIGSRATVHGFGMTQYAQAFPFKTVDSTSWISEFRAIKKELEPGVRSHGCTGRLAEIVGRLSQQQQLKLVLDSYEAAGGEPCQEAIDESFWQARTVVKRYGADELWSKLGFAIIVEDEQGVGRMYNVIKLQTGEKIASMFTQTAAIAVIDDQLTGVQYGCPHN